MVFSLAALPPEKKKELINSLSKEEIYQLYKNPQLFLLPYQQPPKGSWRYHLFLGGRGAGKMLDLSTEVPTPFGWTTIGQLQVGDQLFDEQGQVCQVTDLHPIDFQPESYRIHFDDGTTVNACADHLWKTWDKKARKSYQRSKKPSIHPQVRTTKEIYLTQRTNTSKKEANHSIPLTKPVQYSKKELLIDPYVLGVWLGDGNSNTGVITTADLDVCKFIHQAGYSMNVIPSTIRKDNKSCSFRIHGLHQQLKELNLLNNKHIPSQYLQGSVTQRMSLLQGLMDSDGTSGRYQEFYNTNKKLAFQTFELIKSLGIKANISEGDATLYGRVISKKYRIYFNTQKPVFKLKRKLNLINLNKGHLTRTTHRFITKVEKIEPIPMRCISVSSPSKLFLITKSFIPTHNTFSGISWLVSKINKGAKSTAIYGTDYNSIANQLVPLFLSHYEHLPKDQQPVYNAQKQVITLTDTSKSKSYPAYRKVYLYSSEKVVRGPNIDYLFVDEIVAHCGGGPNMWDKIYENFQILDLAVRSTRIKNPQIFIASTPAPMPFFLDFIKNVENNNPLYSIQKANTFENIYLTEASKAAFLSRYDGTRLGRQELYAEILVDVDGALWKNTTIEQNRISPPEYQEKINNHELYPVRRVLALDPSVSESNTADETGLVIAELGSDGKAYVIQDLTAQMTPNEWVNKCVNEYHNHEIDCLIYEKNQGGLLIERAIRSHPRGRTINLKPIHAKRGKLLRAEPVAALYEQGKVKHIGTFKNLEYQMTTFDGSPSKKSPGSLDAAVYAITELLLDKRYINRDVSNIGTY